MHIYCDESGGVGRGVMTLAALAIAPADARAVFDVVRTAADIRGELKGSRIDPQTRAFMFDQLDTVAWDCVVSVAISATQPEPGADRGDHDVDVYAALLEDAVTPLLASRTDCAQVVIDEGRYSDQVLAQIRRELASLLGPCGQAHLQESHRLPGLQLADVIANSFFSRALPGDKQSVMAAIVQPRMDAGRIRMRVLKRAED